MVQQTKLLPRLCSSSFSAILLQAACPFLREAGDVSLKPNQLFTPALHPSIRMQEPAGRDLQGEGAALRVPCAALPAALLPTPRAWVHKELPELPAGAFLRSPSRAPFSGSNCLAALWGVEEGLAPHCSSRESSDEGSPQGSGRQQGLSAAVPSRARPQAERSCALSSRRFQEHKDQLVAPGAEKEAIISC